MDKLPVSLIVIARNEAHNLGRCLESVAPWVSEIVGVVNDCEDGTEAIFEKYGGRVYERAWEGSTEQKGYALSLAEEPWVLSLDADEEVPEALAEEIRAFIEGGGKGCAGMRFPRRTRFMGRWIRHGDWYPDYVLRLFRREEACFVGGKDHERVEVAGKVGTFRSDLNHYGFPSLNSLVEKLPRFGDAHLKYQLERGKRFSLMGALFRAFWRGFRCYVLKRGFLDGVPGVFIGLNQVYYTFYRYVKLYEHEREEGL